MKKKKEKLPEFTKTLRIMKDVHEKKNEDYSNFDNPFSNFDISEYLCLQFKTDRDKVFVWPIATKLARIANLLNNSNTPNNESIQDSLVDIANYVILWKCDLSRRRLNTVLCNEKYKIAKSLLDGSFSLIEKRKKRRKKNETND